MTEPASESSYRPFARDAQPEALSIRSLETWQRMLEATKLASDELRQLQQGADRSMRVGTQLLKVLELQYSSTTQDVARMRELEKGIETQFQAMSERLQKLEERVKTMQDRILELESGSNRPGSHPVSYRALLDGLQSGPGRHRQAG